MKMSRIEFEALQTAQRAKCKPDYLDEPVHREKDLHADILAEVARRGWIAFHGSMAHATFRTPGEPDFVILAPAKEHCMTARDAMPRVFLVEAKTAKGKISAAQQAIHGWAAKLGHHVYVVRSMADFIRAIE